ncbi:MAG: tetratricopeptide repeat protein [Nitrospinae bacterium]|nr:tetratricopeptide repeat protein [Nitrospinota bacterium]
MANVYFKNNRLDMALDVCVKGLSNRPAYHSARFMLGEIYYAQGEFDLAAEELKAVIAKKPENTGAISLLAEIYIQKADFEKASMHFKRLIELNPNNKKAIEALSILPSENQEHHEKTEVETENQLISSSLKNLINDSDRILKGDSIAPEKQTPIEATDTEDFFMMPDLEEEALLIPETEEEENAEENHETVQEEDNSETFEIKHEMEEELVSQESKEDNELDEQETTEEIPPSILDENAALNEIKDIFQDNEEKEKVEAPLEEVALKKNKKVVNTLEGWLEKLENK